MASSVSEINRNLRRKYKAAIKRLESIISSNTVNRKGKSEARRQIKRVEQAIKTTYQSSYGKEHTEGRQKQIKSWQHEANMIAQGTKFANRGAYGAENWAFMQKVNKAVLSGDAMNELAREDVEAFYRATENIWFGRTNYNTRNTAIIKALGVHTLEEAYNKVMSNEQIRSQVEIQKAIRYKGKDFDVSDLSPEAQQYYEGQKVADSTQSAEGSPEWVMALPQFQKNSSGSWVIGEVSGEVEK